MLLGRWTGKRVLLCKPVPEPWILLVSVLEFDPVCAVEWLFGAELPGSGTTLFRV